MLNVTRLPLGIYQTNCYIIREQESSACCILDPGGESKKVLELLANRGLTLDAIGGEVLVVSQFTLYGNCRKGRRPSFTEAAGPELGNALYEKFLSICEELGYPPQHGQFGADMKVESINDGPVTILLDTAELMDTPRHK